MIKSTLTDLKTRIKYLSEDEKKIERPYSELYSVSDIQDYFEYIIKKIETIADNPPV